MGDFFHGWRRKAGMMLIILPLTFSWRLVYICIEDEPMIEQWRFHPNWVIIVPLTLLSAYLILWKPRKVGAGQKCEPSEPETTQPSLTDFRGK